MQKSKQFPLVLKAIVILVCLLFPHLSKAGGDKSTRSWFALDIANILAKGAELHIPVMVSNMEHSGNRAYMIKFFASATLPNHSSPGDRFYLHELAFELPQGKTVHEDFGEIKLNLPKYQDWLKEKGISAGEEIYLTGEWYTPQGTYLAHIWGTDCSEQYHDNTSFCLSQIKGLKPLSASASVHPAGTPAQALFGLYRGAKNQRAITSSPPRGNRLIQTVGQSSRQAFKWLLNFSQAGKSSAAAPPQAAGYQVPAIPSAKPSPKLYK